MRPDSQDHSRSSRRQEADVIRFTPRDGVQKGSDPNPYDGFDAIDPDETDDEEVQEPNPYDGFDAIDPYAPDESDYTDGKPDDGVMRMDQGYGQAQVTRRQVQTSQPEAYTEGRRRFVRRSQDAVQEPYDGYDYDRGGYPLGADTPVSSYDEPRGYSSQDGYGYASEPPAAPGEPRRGGGSGKSPRKGRRVPKGLIVFVAIVVGLVLLYQAVFGPIDAKLAFSDSDSTDLSQELSWHIPATPYYVLALGSDAREGDTVSRTDTMILARIDPIESKVTLVSIPRDTMVEIEGHGTQKINAAYAFGGASGAVKAVSSLVGVPISHVAVVSFDAVSNLVDYLGGVTVDVPVAVNDPYYTGLVLSAGEQTMDGNTAMLFSRVRHGFANGDYQRQADQRILIQAIMKKCLSLSPVQLPGLVDAVSEFLSTDMRCYQLMPLALRFVITSPTVYSCSLQGTSKMVDGVSYEVLDSSEIQTVMARVNAGDDPSTDSATVAQQSIG